MPIYDPPKLKTMFNSASERIDARLKIARTTPVIEIQFLIEDGNFMKLNLNGYILYFGCKFVKITKSGNIFCLFIHLLYILDYYEIMLYLSL